MDKNDQHQDISPRTDGRQELLVLTQKMSDKPLNGKDIPYTKTKDKVIDLTEDQSSDDRLPDRENSADQEPQLYVPEVLHQSEMRIDRHDNVSAVSFYGEFIDPDALHDDDVNNELR